MQCQSDNGIEEAARLKCSDAAIIPAERPSSFGSDYKLPLHRKKLLEEVNYHSRDDKIVFYEVPHIYTIEGHPVQASVSGLAAEYESHFDKDKSLKLMKMTRSQAWPRLKYSINPTPLEDASLVSKVAEETYPVPEGFMMIDDISNLTLSSITKGKVIECGTSIVNALIQCQTKSSDNSVTFYRFERAMTDEEIFKAWEDNGEEARNRGTEAHLQMELWFNSESVRLEDGEVQVGLNFVRNSLVPIGAKGFRTEWTIYGEDENIAGCIDLAVRLPNGNLYIVDWKRSVNLEEKMTSRAKMKAPFDHLDDCNGCAYALQLSCYQYIIEKYYNFKVDGRALCSIHPDWPFTTSVPYMASEVEFIMQRRRDMHRLRIQFGMNSHYFHLTCSESKRIVIRAAFSDGKLFDEKVAKLKELKYEVCEWTTKRAERLIETKLPPIFIPPEQKKHWRKVFPSPSADLFAFN